MFVLLFSESEVIIFRKQNALFLSGMHAIMFHFDSHMSPSSFWLERVSLVNDKGVFGNRVFGCKSISLRSVLEMWCESKL